jgi:putative hydrolase of the HAD superfamily
MHKLLETKKAILFDLFHTLIVIESNIHNRPMTHEVLGVGKEEWRFQILQNSHEGITGKLTDPIEIIAGLARNIDPDISDEVIERAVENRIALFADAIINVPDETIAVLRYFKTQGKKVALVSNADCWEVSAWDRSPMAAFFDNVIFSCAAGVAKPDRRIYELCLNAIGIEAADAVFIGDGGSNELHGAQQVGLTTIMITGNIRSLWPERIAERRQHADYEIELLGELIGAVPRNIND